MLLLGKFGQLGYPWLDSFRAAAGVFGVGVRWGGEIGRAAAGICYGDWPCCCWEIGRAAAGNAAEAGGFDPPGILAFAAGIREA